MFLNGIFGFILVVDREKNEKFLKNKKIFLISSSQYHFDKRVLAFSHLDLSVLSNSAKSKISDFFLRKNKFFIFYNDIPESKNYNWFGTVSFPEVENYNWFGTVPFHFIM
jgi:hypothetical protein